VHVHLFSSFTGYGGMVPKDIIIHIGVP
jgi:hypothetical protein